MSLPLKTGHLNCAIFTPFQGGIMIYAYIRVSTDKQTVENQRFEIERYAEQQNLKIDKWIEETVSGTKDPNERKLGKCIKRMEKDDIIIAIELSRLGRNLLMIMSILNTCMDKGIKIWTIHDNYKLGDDISSKVLAFAFGLSAEIERNLISQRTKEGLARRRAEGVILGRPKGRKSDTYKLTGREDKIKTLLSKGISKRKMAKRLKVNRNTLSRFINEHMQI